jgi:hypothetical protein
LLLSLLCATHVAVCSEFWPTGLKDHAPIFASRRKDPNLLLVVCAESSWACH